jgi:predicted Rossmann fold flavoprotein
MIKDGMIRGDEHKPHEKWDLIVIGGGPAGMMAAGTAASRGLRVLLLEKNSRPGEKLLITGGGRCNVTNAHANPAIKTGDRNLSEISETASSDIATFLKKYKDSDKFLFSPFSKFSIEDTLEFFESRGMPTKVEAEGRVFPVSNTAQSVWDVLVANLRKQNVTVRSNAEVDGFVLSDDFDKKDDAKRATETSEKTIKAVKLKSKSGEGETIAAKSFILATGGTSRPETGSTGDGFKWLKKIGHTIVPSNPSLVPIAIKDNWVKKLQGITLTGIKLSLSRIRMNDEKNDEKIPIREKIKSSADKAGKGGKEGKILFTHFGISGPTVLNMSKEVSDALRDNDYDDVIITLDLLPALDYGKLDAALQLLFQNNSNKKLKNSLGELLPHATSLVQTILDKTSAKISGTSGQKGQSAHPDPTFGDTKNNSVTREARNELVHTIKGLDMHVAGLLGDDKAIVSSGGVALDEVDFKTMGSRIVPNLHLVGDVLNIDRPSGGYSLQLCWTTGFVAGESVEGV